MLSTADALVVSDYVICTTLRKIADVFDADLLWAPRRQPDGVPLLEALQRHRRAAPDHPRRTVSYHHVLIRIPERNYVSDDRLESGLGRKALLRALQERHELALSDEAHPVAIRYRVEPHPFLKPGEVQCLFGRAIYAPAADEVPAFQIQAATKQPDQWRHIALVYPTQRLTLLNGDAQASSVIVTAWPFTGGESVLIILRADADAADPTRPIDVLAEPPGSLTVLHGSGGDFTAQDRRGRNIRLQILPVQTAQPVFAAPPLVDPLGDKNPHITLAAEPHLSVVESVIPMTDPWGRREPIFGWPVHFEKPEKPERPLPTAHTIPPTVAASAPQCSDETFEKTWIPQQPAAALQIVGIALHRLSTYAATGLRAWRLGFNRAGQLVASQHPEAAAWLSVDHRDQLSSEVAGQITPLTIPICWQPWSDVSLEWSLHIAPEPMNAHYLGWVQLLQPIRLPFVHGRSMMFGRGSEADIAPGLLSDPHALHWDDHATKTAGMQAEHLGLSRQHLRIESRHQDWWVQLNSQNMPAYCLTAEGALSDVLTPRVHIATTMQPGERLVVGGYVLSLGETLLALRPDHAR